MFFINHITRQEKNHIHKDWKETFQRMCSEISKLDFDIALIGCGGYGVPLAGFIYNKLKKQAIQIGGGLQLLFGVMGKKMGKYGNVGNYYTRTRM